MALFMYNESIMLTTNAFAKLCRTTKRTIIHYDEIALLKPIKRHGIYRMYDSKQVLLFQKIILLKSLGFSLHETKSYLHKLTRLLPAVENKLNELNKEKELLIKQISRVEEYKTSLQKKGIIINPKIITVKPFQIYAQEQEAKYIEVNNLLNQIYQQINDPSHKNKGITIYKDRAFKPELAHMIIGVITKSNKPAQFPNISILRIPQHKALSYVHVGSYKFLSYIWEEVFNAIQKNNLQESRSLFPYEIYWKRSNEQDDKSDNITEVRFPLE